MIPTGHIYNDLRARMLGCIPEGANVKFRANHSFSEWLSTSVVSAVKGTGSQLLLHANDVSTGEFLLSLVEYYQNHAIEQVAEIVAEGNDNSESRSPAWCVVTQYYFGYYCINALAALIGRPVLFLSDNDSLMLHSLCGGKEPGAGTYAVESIVPATSNLIQCDLRKRRTRLHDSVWKRTLALLSDVMRAHEAVAREEEKLFFSSFLSSNPFAMYEDYAWPSNVRNAANYVLGCAYREAVGEKMGNLRGNARYWSQVSDKEFNRRLVASSALCAGKNNGIHLYAKYMCGIGWAAFKVLRSLYLDLLDRRSHDLRWEQARQNYAQRVFAPDVLAVLQLKGAA